MSIPVRVIAAAGMVLAAVLGAASAASATEGSVPPEVAEFAAAPDGLVVSLEDFFGVGADGRGIDFDESTEVGRIDRVFGFTPAFLAGEKTDVPVIVANQWVVPVSIAQKPMGVAVIWINPGTVRPQLADFLPDREFAAALAGLPDDSYVVADAPRGAWLLMQPPALTPLLAGESGIAAGTTLSAYQGVITRTPAAPVEDAVNLGSVLSVGIIVAVALVVVLVLLVPIVWRRRRPLAGEAPADEG